MSDPVWPSFTFTVDLSLFATEQIGPNTNSADVDVLHADQYQSSPDQGRTETSNRQNTRSTWLPNLLAGLNRQLKHGDSFIVTGEKALYIRDTYGKGFAPADRAYLDVTVNTL
jgi:hypothetical protein